jgi:hypothetical protein
MPGLSDWSPYKTHVQGGLRAGQFVNGQFVLICAGPPFLEDIGGGSAVGGADAGAVEVVYPIGLTQNFTLSQNKAISRIFEIGSDRSYFMSGRSVGQVTMFRVMYHGPSLLRSLYAYYGQDSGNGVKIDPLYQSLGAINPNNFPFTDGGGNSAVEGSGTLTKISGGLHEVQIPPGYDNMFINLASDLFSQPMGLLLILKDNAENNVSYTYLENCRIPSHTLAIDSQGLIAQESVSIQYERLVPIKVTAVKLLDKILPDLQGGSSF